MPKNNYSEKLDEFFQQFKSLNFEKKDIVLHANSFPANIYYIKNGYIRVYRISEEGEELTLIILKPKDFFPVSLGIDDAFSQYYLEAITPLEVYKVPLEQFTQFIKNNTDIFYELTNIVINRFGDLMTRLEHLIISRAYTKVAITILACAKSFGEEKGTNVILNLPLTHKDIANLVGITRETTCLEMKKLEKKGLIAHQGRLLIIKDIQKLEEESVTSQTSSMFLN